MIILLKAIVVNDYDFKLKLVAIKRSTSRQTSDVTETLLCTHSTQQLEPQSQHLLRNSWTSSAIEMASAVMLCSLLCTVLLASGTHAGVLNGKY